MANILSRSKCIQRYKNINILRTSINIFQNPLQLKMTLTSFEANLDYRYVIWVSRRIRSSAIRKLVQQLVRADMKGSIITGPLWVKSTVTQGPVMQKVFPWHDITMYWAQETVTRDNGAGELGPEVSPEIPPEAAIQVSRGGPLMAGQTWITEDD